MPTTPTTVLRDFPLPLRVDENGDIRVGKTRVLLDMIVYCFRDGATPEQTVERFVTLDLPDVYAAVAYYLRNREEVDAYVRRREEAGEALRRKFESDPVARASREQLLARIGRAG